MDFLRKLSPPHRDYFEDIIPSIVSQLLFYREEGKFLYPDVYLITDEEALKILPGYNKYKIAEGKKEDKSIVSKAIKKCAPLCEKSWSIYVLISGEIIEYGLFSVFETVASVLREESILNTDDDSPIVFSIRILRDKLISVSARSERLYVYFDVTDEHEVTNVEDVQSKFISNIVSSIDEEKKETVTNFLRRLFIHVYRYGHGTLACVIDSETKLEEIFKDGIILSSPIEIAADFSDKERRISVLDGAFELISGMMQSDGVTVFTNDGKVKAYNVFLELKEKKDDKEKNTGGARSRAYYALCHTEGVKTAYMQSQDGKVLINE